MVAKRPTAIMSLSDFDESINMLVYGDSGAGKTVLAGTASKGLILPTERGTISAKRQGSNSLVWPVNDWSDVQAAYTWLKNNPDHGFDWVSMDSITEMQQILLRWILDKAVSENSNRDPDIPAIQDHQKWQNMFKRFIKSFNSLPVNMLYTATTARHEDEEGDDIILPDLAGKGYGIAQHACAAMHVVGYLSVAKRKDGTKYRRLMCETNPPYFGKDRYDVLVKDGKPMINPTMTKITELIGAPTTVAEKPTKTTRPRPPGRRLSSVK